MIDLLIEEFYYLIINGVTDAAIRNEFVRGARLPGPARGPEDGLPTQEALPLVKCRAREPFLRELRAQHPCYSVLHFQAI